ncbi:MAG: hypothetical protein ACI9P8_000940 [Bacteroidia bacterium]|jgi:hypothetical protein
MRTPIRLATLLLIPSIGFGQALTDDGTNVGIGNTAPAHRLDVNGAINISSGNALMIGGNQVIGAAGSRNIFIGEGTGQNITSGADNAIIGFKAGETLETGTYNTLIGLKSGQFMTSGSSNTVIGRFAGKNSNGNRNVLIGRESGINTVGDDNTFIGNRAGLNATIGNDNTFIGKDADATLGNLINATAIGSGAQATGSNMIQLGNSIVTDVKTSGQLTTGGVTYPNLDGAAGQVLTTDGSGLAMWATPSGIVGPTGVIGQTIYHDGTDWVSTSNLSNDGTTVRTSADAIMNGVTIGHGGGNVSSNTAFGDSVLFSNTAGAFNTASGYQSLFSNTAGNMNTANGVWSLFNNTEGFANTAAGAFTLLSNTTGDMNTASGFSALLSNTTGSENTANGSSALHFNTQGTQNTAVGKEALYANTAGSYNTANGYQALHSNTTGTENTAIGMWALYYNTDGFGNTANGNFTLLSNTNGDYNTAGGYAALYTNTSGSENTAYGSNALYWNSGGARNTASGVSALYANTSGSFNTANGFASLSKNTTGTGNTAHGDASLLNNKTGFYSTAIGQSALLNNTEGYYNTATGHRALFANTTGYRNTAFGYYALGNNLTGNYLTAMGLHSNSLSIDYDNTTGLGYNADPSASNSVQVGNGSITSIGGQVGWTTLSDKRFKTDVRTDEIKGLEFITSLEPVTYNYDIDAQDAWKKENYGEVDSSKWEGKYDIEQVRFSGFIAQDVEALAKEIGYSFSGVDAPQNDKDVYGLRYAEFVVPLVKAVQELNTEKELQKEQIEAQRIENEELRAMLSQILENQQGFYSDLEKCCLDYKQGSANSSFERAAGLGGDAARLEQNQPNPFRENSVIKYYLPAGTTSAQLQISDLNGSILKAFELQGKGFGQVLISGGSLGAGTYLYTLTINGNPIDSKRMMLL